MKLFVFGLLAKSVFIFSIVFSCYGQKTTEPNQNLIRDQVVKAENNQNSCKEWKRIELGKFSFFAPEIVKMEKKVGVDLSAWTYEDKDIQITIYSGSRSPTAGGTVQRLPSYKQKKLWIDNISTIIWFYDEEQFPYKYTSAARYYVENTAAGDAITIYVRSSQSDSEWIAEKIFDSVKFTNRK